MSEINLDDDDDDDSRKALGLDEQPAACLQSHDLFSCKAASVFLSLWPRPWPWPLCYTIDSAVQ